VADWLSKGNRVSEYSWVSKFRSVENLRLMVDKAKLIGYSDGDVRAFELLSEKLSPLRGR
jgi:hypothetical protein